MAEPAADPRRRTITWPDPKATLAAMQAMSGAERAQAWVSGALPPPPVAALVGWTVRSAEAGRALIELLPAEYHYNPFGSVHGGLLCSLVDEAIALAVASSLPAGVAATTLEMKVNFVRPIRAETGLIRCEGETLYVGGRIATAQARVLDALGTLYAHGTATWMVMR